MDRKRLHPFCQRQLKSRQEGLQLQNLLFVIPVSSDGTHDEGLYHVAHHSSTVGGIEGRHPKCEILCVEDNQ